MTWTLRRIQQPADRMPKNLTSTRLIYLKGVLFLLTGLLASTVILLHHPSLKVAALLGLAAWSFARAYYFRVLRGRALHRSHPSLRGAGRIPPLSLQAARELAPTALFRAVQSLFEFASLMYC